MEFYELTLLMQLPEKPCANRHLPANASLAHLDLDDTKIVPFIDLPMEVANGVRTGVFEICVIWSTTDFRQPKDHVLVVLTFVELPHLMDLCMGADRACEGSIFRCVAHRWT